MHEEGVRARPPRRARAGDRLGDEVADQGVEQMLRHPARIAAGDPARAHLAPQRGAEGPGALGRE